MNTLARANLAPADQECAAELLHDLVMLLNEQAATGGGPNYYARWRAALQRAEQFLGLDQ